VLLRRRFGSFSPKMQICPSPTIMSSSHEDINEYKDIFDDITERTQRLIDSININIKPYRQSMSEKKLQLLMRGAPAVIIKEDLEGKEDLDEESFLSHIAAGDSARVRKWLAEEGCLIHARDESGRGAFHFLRPTDHDTLDALCDAVRDSEVLTKVFFYRPFHEDSEPSAERYGALYFWAAAENEPEETSSPWPPPPPSHPILLALRRFMFHTRDLWCSRALETVEDVSCEDIVWYLQMVAKAEKVGFEGNTILHVTSDPPLVDELLKMGLSLKTPNNHHRLPIHEWILRSRTSPDMPLNWLVDLVDSDWAWRDEDGSTAFHYLMSLKPPFGLGADDVVDLLSTDIFPSCGKTWMNKDNDGDTPLHVLCICGGNDPTYLKRILTAPHVGPMMMKLSPFFVYDALGRLPHHLAYIYHGSHVFVDCIHDGTITTKPQLDMFFRMLHMPELFDGMTLLHMASEKGDALLVEKLLPVFSLFGIGIDIRTAVPSMLLHQDHVEYEPLDISHKEKYGKTALHFANTASIARLLLENGADPAARSFSHMMPLHYAKNAEIAELLLDAGAPIDGIFVQPHPLSWHKNRTPLEMSIKQERWDVAEVLIRRGAAVNGFFHERQISWELRLGHHPKINRNPLFDVSEIVRFTPDLGADQVRAAITIAELLMRRGADSLMDFKVRMDRRCDLSLHLRWDGTHPTRDLNSCLQSERSQRFAAVMLAHDAALQIPDDEFDAYWDSRIPSPCYGLLEQIDALKRRYGNKVLAHVGKRIPEAQKACVHEIMHGCYFRKISEPACWTILKFYVM
jgi:ankyrin repeat protein